MAPHQLCQGACPFSFGSQASSEVWMLEHLHGIAQALWRRVRQECTIQPVWSCGLKEAECTYRGDLALAHGSSFNWWMLRPSTGVAMSSDCVTHVSRKQPQWPCCNEPHHYSCLDFLIPKCVQ